MNFLQKRVPAASLSFLFWFVSCAHMPENFSEPSAPAPPDRAEELQVAQSNNPDTVAWLTVPGTDIDGPVQQAADNDYYMRRDELGKPSYEGCFLPIMSATFLHPMP